MGRLFWKFFFSYWGALLIAVLGVGTAGWLVQLSEQGRDPSLESGPRASSLVASAGATIRHGGLSALRALMTEWGQHGNSLLFAVDDSGRDLLGRPVAADALERARKVVAEDVELEHVRRVSLSGGGTILLYVPLEAEPWLRRLLLGSGPPAPWVPLTVGTLASLIFGALLAWYVTRPIRHLRAAFASLSQGRLETRVAPLMGGRRDEVADLGRHFDAMAQRLQTLIDAQRTLLHEVSHELRSPLARLEAAIGLARQSPVGLDPVGLGPVGLEEAFERIEREAERVDELVGQLLTLSRLEASALGASTDTGAHWRLECVDLIDLVAAVAADAHFEAQASGRTVVFEGSGEALAEVRAELLHRAVENIVRNAIKYTRAGTAVEVRAGLSDTDGAFVVSVSDRGPGVAEGELESIFRPFYRGADRAPGPGFGLGLAIARRAVEAHGGRVRALNRQGGGLVIELVLPFHRPSNR